MDTTPRLTCLPLVVVILTIPALYSENLNVSPIAISGRNLNWTEEAAAPRERGGAPYTFFQMGRTRGRRPERLLRYWPVERGMAELAVVSGCLAPSRYSPGHGDARLGVSVLPPGEGRYDGIPKTLGKPHVF